MFGNLPCAKSTICRSFLTFKRLLADSSLSWRRRGTCLDNTSLFAVPGYIICSGAIASDQDSISTIDSKSRAALRNSSVALKALFNDAGLTPVLLKLTRSSSSCRRPACRRCVAVTSGCSHAIQPLCNTIGRGMKRFLHSKLGVQPLTINILLFVQEC